MGEALRIGEMLIEAGALTQEQLDIALETQKQFKERLGETLIRLGYVSEAILVETLSSQLSIPWVSLNHVEFSRDLLNLLPADVAKRDRIIPVYRRKSRGHADTIFVAMADPTQTAMLQDISRRIGLAVKPMVAAPSDIRNAIRVYYFGGKDSSPPPQFAPPESLPPPESVPPPMARRSKPPPPPRAVGEKIAHEVGAPVERPPNRASEVAPVEKQVKAVPKPETRIDSKAEPKAATQPKMITLTLLDGTTVRLPASPAAATTDPEPLRSQMTAKDLVYALYAKAQGVDSVDPLNDARWESFFGSLLHLLLKKGLISDWEFIEEFEKNRKP